MNTTTRRIVAAAALDVLSIAIFVVIGRRNHDEGSAASQTFETAAPFLIALAVGWGAARAWRTPMAVGTALAIWPITVLIGMLLRNLAFDRGTAVSFVIVATLFLGMCLIGWRAIAILIRR